MLNEDKLRDDQTPIAATLKQAQRLAHGNGEGDSKFRKMARDRAVMLRRAQKKGGVHINSSYEPQGTMLEKLRPTMREINWAILKNERDKEKNKGDDTQESFIGKFDSLGKKMGKIARRIGRMG